MSYKALHKRRIDEMRVSHETVTLMLEAAWTVIAVCTTCEVMLTVDLRWIIRYQGPQVSLWNKRQACRRVGCEGLMRFKVTRPETNRWEVLEGDWPEERCACPPGSIARAPRRPDGQA